MDLTKQQKIEAAALHCKHEREATLAQVIFPTRKTGEMNKLNKLAKLLHEVLLDYDVQVDPPALSDMLAENYNEIVARLVELTTPKPASAPPPAESAE